MKCKLLLLTLSLNLQLVAQNSTTLSPFDSRYWGVVLEHPDMKKVVVKRDVTYLSDDKGNLKIDIYMPPNMKPGDRIPAIIFLNGIGESLNPQDIKLKTWGIYSTWPKLVAANGFVGISMETDGSRVQECFQSLFKYLSEKGADYNLDAQRLGVYAASANVGQSAAYLMNANAYKGIKAAVLYYGFGTPLAGPYRRDLPVFFVAAEGDTRRANFSTLWNEVLKNNAPWTIKMGTGLPHGFDAFDDTEESKKVVEETILFWKNQLVPLVQPSREKSIPREGWAALNMQDYTKSADLAQQWLVTHPEDASALEVLSMSLKSSNRLAEAENVLKKRLTFQPNDVGILIDLVLVSHVLNKTGEAEGYLSQAMKTGAVNRFNYLNLGMALYYNKKYKESAFYYGEALKSQPTGVDYYNQGCSYALANEKDKAFISLDKAIELGSNGKGQFENDTDLAILKTDNRWMELLKKLK